MRPIFPALAFALAAAPSLAQEAFTWVYDAQLYVAADLSELHLTATTQAAGFGSDDPNRPNGLIWARCGNFGDGNVAIRFEAPAAAEQPDDQVEFLMMDDIGNVIINDAFIVARENDPVGGPEIVVRADGPELAMLANAQVVTYGLADIPALQVSFDLTANQTYVRRFADDCDYSRGSLMPDLSLEPFEAGPGITGHVWLPIREIVDGDPFATRLEAVLGVPETDDLLVRAQCFIGAGGPLVSMQVAADVTGLTEGLPVDLFVEAGGQNITLGGSAVNIRAEFGVVGVEIVLELGDPAWLLLAGENDVTLTRVGGQQGMRVIANGPDVLGPFLRDCENIGDLTVEGGTSPIAPDAPQAGFIGCERFGQVASGDFGAPFVVNFVNATSGFRHLDWIDPQGNVVAVGSLQPGEAVAFTTDPGHIWMFSDGPGNCREMFQPQAGVSEHRITVE